MTEPDNYIQLDGGIAVGAYLRFLRDAQGITAIEAADRANTNQSQIWRIDNWKSDTRGSLLFAYMRVVNADPYDVAKLINNPKATISDGETLAKLRLAILKF